MTAAQFWFVLWAGFLLGALGMYAFVRLDRIGEWLYPDAWDDDALPRHVRLVPGVYDQDAS